MKKPLISCLLSAFIAVSFYGGCDKDKGETKKAEDKKTEEKADEEKQPQAETDEKEEPAPAKVELHKELADAIRKAASDCDLTQRFYSSKCEEYKIAENTYKEVRESHPSKTIETISVMFTDDDPNVSTIATNFLYSSETGYMIANQASKQPSFIDKATAERLLAGMKQLTETKKEDDLIKARRMAEIVTHAVTMAGLLDELVEFYKEAGDVHVKRTILEHIMRYGGMDAFPTVKNEAEGDDANLKAIALRAPTRMRTWTDEEQKALCPFGLQYLSDENIAVAANAARIAVRCKHEEGYVEKLLEEGRRRVKEGQWEGEYVFPYRDICFTGFVGQDKIPPEETCEKVYDFLEWVANQNNVDPAMRGRALDMIFYQRRDAKTHKLMRKYRRHKVKEVQQAALEVMKKLEESYLKKK